MKRTWVRTVERVSIVDSIAGRLRARILSNDLQEGQQLRQEAIADLYAVSRMPVREALRQLEAEGLVIFHRRRGAVVSKLEPAEVEELFDLRALIEADLIARAAPLAGEADYSACHAALVASEEAYRNRDVASWGELNWEFHQALYRPAGRERSMVLVRTLNLNTDRYVRLQLSLTDSSIEDAKAEHRALFDSYRARDVEASVSMLRRHLAHVRDALVEALAVRN